jgi:hypothetical protein
LVFLSQQTNQYPVTNVTSIHKPAVFPCDDGPYSDTGHPILIYNDLIQGIFCKSENSSTKPEKMLRNHGISSGDAGDLSAADFAL